MGSERKWEDVRTAPAGVELLTKIHDADGERNVQPMRREGNLWWINYGQPNAMYVYYRPTHWSWP